MYPLQFTNIVFLGKIYHYRPNDMAYSF